MLYSGRNIPSNITYRLNVSTEIKSKPLPQYMNKKRTKELNKKKVLILQLYHLLVKVQVDEQINEKNKTQKVT